MRKTACVHICAYMFIRTYSEDGSRYLWSDVVYSFCLFVYLEGGSIGVSHQPGTCQVGLPAREPQEYTCIALHSSSGIKKCVLACLKFLYEFWWSESSPSACKASTFPISYFLRSISIKFDWRNFWNWIFSLACKVVVFYYHTMCHYHTYVLLCVLTHQWVF